MQQNDAKEYVDFWNFWRWQYISRNTKYRKEYEKFQRTLRNTIKRSLKEMYEKRNIASEKVDAVFNMVNDKINRQYQIDKFLADVRKDKFGVIAPSVWLMADVNALEDDMIYIFRDKFDYHPVSPERNTNSEKIMGAIQNSTLNKELFLPDQLDHCFQYKLIDDGRIEYTICLAKNIDQVVAEVKYLYSLNNSSSCKYCERTLPTIGKKTSMHDTESAYYEIVKIKLAMKGLSFKVDDNPRAVGLWIWDYLTNKYGRNSLPHGAITEAINELKSRFELQAFGYATSQQKVLEDKYRGTCRCIESCEVLPF